MKPLVAITGASSGIGSALARRFSEAGHPLLLMARRLERLVALNLPHAICERVDVTRSGEVAAAIERAEAAYGPLDCLVNNAGTMKLGQIDAQDPREWEQMFEINVLALIGAMAAVMGPMRERGGGTIINIGSTSGHTTFPHHAAYTGTKFAVNGISRNVREEVASDGVRVVCVSPGATSTEIMEHTTSEALRRDYAAWRNEIGGVMEPDDVARAAVFAYQMPESVCVREIVLAPTRQVR